MLPVFNFSTCAAVALKLVDVALFQAEFKYGTKNAFSLAYVSDQKRLENEEIFKRYSQTKKAVGKRRVKEKTLP